MSLARFFSKPRWQSKDETIRRAAVASDADGELIEFLPKLAREDGDAGVRIAAMRRLADPGLTQAMANDDRDEGVRHAARNLWSELLAGTHAAAPSLTDRLRLLRAQDDPRLVEHIAISAPEAELRLAALRRIDRQPLLLERITADSDAQVRRAALERVADETQLARIVERTRKSDKIISRLASERLDDLRVGRGDTDAIESRARGLCERLERVLREGDRSEEAAAIDASWSAIAGKVPVVYAARYRNARDLFELSRNPLEIARLRQRAQDRVRIEHELSDIERMLAGATVQLSCTTVSQRFDALADLHSAFVRADDESAAAISVRFAVLGARIATLKSSSCAAEISAEDEVRSEAAREQIRAERTARQAAERLAREQRQQEAINALRSAMQATAQAIHSGKTADAHASHADMLRLLRQMGSVPAALRETLNNVESEYARIAQWQRWSDNQRRQQLCAELEALPQSGLHPDALATRLRDIQAEWTLLDRIEARPANAGDGIARRFRALCRKAIEPAKPYFEKRDELRKQGSKDTEALIRDASNAAAEEEPDWRLLATLRKQLADALHGLDRVDPRERKTLAADLKGALAAVDGRIQARHSATESVKSDLIARANALASHADTRTAMTQARELQKLWQNAGNGRRARDQAQWNEFRRAVDAVFARADNERAERSARDQQALASATALCAQLEELAGNPSEPDRAALQRIENAWRALATGDAALRQRYQSALASLHAAESRFARRKHRAQFEIWLSHYALLRRLEKEEIDAGNFPGLRAELPPLILAAEAIEERTAVALGHGEANQGEVQRLRDCVLEIEQLAGIEPVAEDRQRRMDLQLEKLSARMRGVQAPAPDTALQQLLAEWTRLGPVAADAVSLEHRFRKALLATLDTLG